MTFKAEALLPVRVRVKTLAIGPVSLPSVVLAIAMDPRSLSAIVAVALATVPMVYPAPAPIVREAVSGCSKRVSSMGARLTIAVLLLAAKITAVGILA